MWIEKTTDGNASKFAGDIGKKQSYVADLLRGEKSFGEKAARNIESLAKMPAGYLDSDTDDDEPRLMYHGVMLTRSGALLGAEWEKLDLVDRIELEEEIRRRVQKKIVTGRDGIPVSAPPDAKN